MEVFCHEAVTQCAMEVGVCGFGQGSRFWGVREGTWKEDEIVVCKSEGHDCRFLLL